MFDPTRQNDHEEDEGERLPFPSPIAALMLTFGALIAMLSVAVLISDEASIAAVGIGQALGLGGVATLAARRVPAPSAERMGLRALPPRAVLPLLCLVPLVFLTSELDNWAAYLDPDPAVASEELVASGETGGESDTGASLDTDAAAVDAADPEAADEPLAGWQLVELAIVLVGISPVVESFLFFGVLLQGLIAYLGRFRGLLLCGCLYSLIHMVGNVGATLGPARAAAALFSLVLMGTVLALTRVATGSLLAPMLVSVGFVTVQLAAYAAPDWFSVPGFTSSGAHTSLSIIGPSALAVGYALRLFIGQARQPGALDAHPLFARPMRSRRP